MPTLRSALRQLVGSPGYAAAAVLTLGLALGAASALLAAVDAVLLRPLPIASPDRLVVCWETDPQRNKGVVELSFRNVREWAEGSRSFERLAAIGSSNWPAVLTGLGDPARVWLSGVTGSFFATLGASPLLGRVIGPEDDLPTAPQVVVLSHGTWLRRFGGNPAVLGTPVRLDDRPHAIVGVMPDGFDYPRGAEFWTAVGPILAGASADWGTDAFEHVGVLFAVGRLRDGVAPAAAALELNALAARLQTSPRPATRFGSRIVVTPWVDHVFGPVRPVLWLLIAAVGVLVLIACANVSALMLTRVSLRRREHAIRIALGESRAAIARQWGLETVLVCAAGGALGLLGARWIGAGIVLLAPDDVPGLVEMAVDGRVVMAALGLVLAAAVLCGAGPARQAGAPDLLRALGDGARATEGRGALRGRAALVVFQIALAVVLLVSAGLVVRSFRALRAIDLGFAPAHVLTLSVQPGTAASGGHEYYRDLIERIETLPDVESAGAVYLRPLALGPIGQGTWVILEGQGDTPEAAAENPGLNYQVATPGYFAAMRIAVVKGRPFTAADGASQPRVAIVSESTARRLWPDQDPVGRRLLFPSFEKDGRSAWRTVVGVVSDVRYRGIDEVQLDVYDAAAQAAMPTGDLVVRAGGSPLDVLAAVQAAIRRADPRAVIDGVTTMEAIVARARAPWRLGAWLFAVFAGLAFLLAGIGLFGLVALDLAARRRELAVRVALGAAPRAVVRSVVAAGARRAAAGLAIGLGAALLSTRVLGSLLFGVRPLDPPTYAAVIALVLAAVTMASYVPARRAGQIDPAVLLRRE